MTLLIDATAAKFYPDAFDAWPQGISSQLSLLGRCDVQHVTYLWHHPLVTTQVRL